MFIFFTLQVFLWNLNSSENHDNKFGLFGIFLLASVELISNKLIAKLFYFIHLFILKFF